MIDEKRSFFLIVPPGLEGVALNEFEYKTAGTFTSTDYQQVKGGIELQASLELGLSLNSLLKIPTRILLRLDHFKCRDFPKLYNKVKKFPWRHYYFGEIPPISSSSRQSRLIHTDRIQQTVKEGIEESFRHQAPRAKKHDLQAPTLFVRLQDDHCTLSIDTSGERLYFRGEEKRIGLAPLRENMAAALYWSINQHLEPSKKFSIVDPMCGSGTLLIESHDFVLPNVKRDYAYHYFQPPIMNPFTEKDRPLHRFSGMERDKKTFDVCCQNIQKREIEVTMDDCFKLENMMSDYPIVFIVNPPYGKRIAIDRDRKVYYQQLIDHLCSFDQAQWVGIIIPREVPCPKFNRHWTLKETLSFSNGGIWVNFFILHRDRLPSEPSPL